MAPVPSLSSWSPFRKLDWRRIRALKLAEQLKLSPGDDRYVRDYFRFLDSLANADGDEEREADVRRLHPIIWEAHSVFCADIETRQQLEARLLTREAFNRTAQRFDLQEASVRAYEKLFFHCFDRFQSSDWMWLAVIRGDVREAVGEEAQRVARRGFLMRWFGYYGGSIALDAFLGHWPETTGQKAPLDVSKVFDNSFSTYIQAVSAQVEWLLEFDLSQWGRWGRLSEKLKKVAQKHVPSPAETDRLRSGIQYTIDMLGAEESKWIVGLFGDLFELRIPSPASLANEGGCPQSSSITPDASRSSQ